MAFGLILFCFIYRKTTWEISSHDSWLVNNLYILFRALVFITKQSRWRIKEVVSVWVTKKKKKNRKGTKTRHFSFNFYYFVQLQHCLRHQDTCPSNFLDFFLCSTTKKLSLHNHRLFREKTFTKHLVVTLKVRTITIFLLCTQINYHPATVNVSLASYRRLKMQNLTLMHTCRSAFSSPEAALLLVSAKNHDLWEGPTPEVCGSRSARAWSDFHRNYM